MVTVKLFRDSKGQITGFEVRGHAGFAPEGQDIVCAGVSMVAQTAVIGLIRHLSIRPRFEKERGFLICSLPAGLAGSEMEKAQVILTTLEEGLVALETSYPEYVRVVRQGGVNSVQD
ncbi:MAG TPA: ribosomal-processing cysteine protease Prp [Syntrophothermus lipocalidus]|uniref:Ribosomal processing cysteine protease Prp n=1 Tax=Syntrophothermus lipocalidus (strain DSM 12680 / TGB-C1) TaxID=643648 RepID=D7CLA1_SYNLT|nr:MULTISPECIES: ribosomal-processing cysteine protease Prp [Syntrophothermus]ADI01486.1 protein of unknown function DUF464 [Syntrophothermus lipocalidus DSM 12680]NSW82136.1 ribosomal-processing cysteine protease Prp [Syntrophothermus sp.]HHV76789.1 ribosomal-processing cysteine protease Prp [Syntrophothermus lipocalidus]